MTEMLQVRFVAHTTPEQTITFANRESTVASETIYEVDKAVGKESSIMMTALDEDSSQLAFFMATSQGLDS